MTVATRCIAACALLLATPLAFAQESPRRVQPVQDVAPVDRGVPADGARATPMAPGRVGYAASAGGEPDVLLDVPNLSVDEIKLDVENLEAHIALDARLANLLMLKAGADVSIERVNVTIKGVKAQALLKVRLDNVAQIIDRTLTTIDRNPEILEGLLKTVNTTVGTVGNVAGTALQPGGVVDNAVGTVGDVATQALKPGSVLSSTVNSLGQTVQRVVDTSGNVVERTLDSGGKVLGSRVVQRAGQR